MRESSRSSAPQRAKPRKPGLQLDLQDRNTQKFTSSIVDRILARGVGDRASDITSSRPTHLRIRFRIDEVSWSLSAGIRSCRLGSSAKRRNTRSLLSLTSVRALRSFDRTMMYFTGGLLAFLIVRQSWRWWRARVDVDPVSDRWLAEQRGARERD